MMSKKEHTLIIELNEFNLDLLKRAANFFNLKNIKRILSFNSGVTLADQDKEHQGLDPWVQWVSIHSESPSQQHGIIRLGDISKLEFNQIWERLGKQGLTTGVWGVMNGSRRDCPNNQFFVADPWTFSEVAYPSELNAFVSLPVYYAKNYLDLSFIQILLNAGKTSWFILRNIKLSFLLSDFFFLLKGLLRIKKVGTSFLFCAYELLSTRIFANNKKKYNPHVNFIFLNSIAHFQHHDWHDSNTFDPKSEFVFKCVDRMLENILPAENAVEKVLVLSALSQKNVSQDDFYCYRQINPSRFLKTIGLKFSKVEQCMTNDAHVFFSDEVERDRGAELLSTATVDGQPAFFVEKDSDDPLKFFYQVAICDKLEQSAVLKLGVIEMLFFNEFSVYAKRTGAHVPTGSYLAEGFSFPAIIKNCDILSYVWKKSPI